MSQTTNMRSFLIVWSGQMASSIGSYMTIFAITLWAWEVSGQATTLALTGFFNVAARTLVALGAGVLVDRYSRKLQIIGSDVVAALSTIAILGLYSSGLLQIWHLYVIAAINGAFSQLQDLAYSASITLLVPKQHYTRASGLVSTLHYGSSIIAPALAGAIYPITRLPGILTIDLLTFVIAVATVWAVSIPQPVAEQEPQRRRAVWHNLSFGFRYFLEQPGLRALLLASILFTFAHDLNAALFAPMILARSSNGVQSLASVSSAAGVGGVVGALMISVWGGPQRRIHGFLLGIAGAGISKALIALGGSVLHWMPAQFCSSLHFPLLGSSRQGIMQAKVPPAVQGRVFAARTALIALAGAVGRLIAGPLADTIFEPAMRPGGPFVPLFGWLFGVGNGAGIAALFGLSAVTMTIIGLGGYAFKSLRTVEQIVPDHDAIPPVPASS